MGLPDFFNQLQTVAFVRHIDPFEKYFQIKSDISVKELYTGKTCKMSEDNTLMEIIFALTVQNYNRIFVVDSRGCLTGEIDRFSIVDKIMFF
jgi:predicted transcriptional regulator